MIMKTSMKMEKEVQFRAARQLANIIDATVSVISNAAESATSRCTPFGSW